MSYLVTGGCGFIGSHLAEALVQRGARVRVFDNLASGAERNLAAVRDGVEFVHGDIRDRAALAGAMQGIRYVFHEAALVSVFDSVERPADNHDINITGTLNVLMAARAAGVHRLVAASSAAVYGQAAALPVREDMSPAPQSPYALAKIAVEHYLAVFASLYGLPTVSLRYFNVYGPRQDPGSMYSGVISKFVDAVRAGSNPVVFGDGRQTRDFVYVKDVVAANLLAMESPRVGRGEALNVATGRSTSLLDLLSVLRDLSGRAFTAEFRPARAGDIRDSLADVSRARERLGFTADHSLHDGLRALLPAGPQRSTR